MKETENYNLKQIENDDKPSEYPSVQSENMQVIDEQMHELATEVTPIARGGTGATDATAARTALEAASQADLDTLRDSVSRIKVYTSGSVKISNYVDNTGNYLVLGTARTDATHEEIYFSVRNGQLIVDHHKTDGTWESIKLG